MVHYRNLTNGALPNRIIKQQYHYFRDFRYCKLELVFETKLLWIKQTTKIINYVEIIKNIRKCWKDEMPSFFSICVYGWCVLNGYDKMSQNDHKTRSLQVETVWKIIQKRNIRVVTVIKKKNSKYRKNSDRNSCFMYNRKNMLMFSLIHHCKSNEFLNC